MSGYDDLFEQAGRAASTNAWVEEQKANRTKVYGWIEESLEQIGKDAGELRNYLDAQARFIKYSARNTLLIMRQLPQARQLGDYAYWRDSGVYVKRPQRQHPVLILEPGPEYVREDKSVGTYYNVKKVYDISQTTAREEGSNRPAADERMKLRALMDRTPVPICPVDELEDNRGAYYDPEAQEIRIRKGMSGEDIFRSLSCELAHVELEYMGYESGDREMTAYCTSYVLCKRYGIDTALYRFDLGPEFFSGMETKEIGEELKKIRDTAAELAGRMDRFLENQQNRQSREAEKEKSERQERE